jgi:hypothetical protein
LFYFVAPRPGGGLLGGFVVQGLVFCHVV